MQQKEFDALTLPSDILKIILSFLDKKTILNFRLVHSLFENISRNFFFNMVFQQIRIACGDYTSYLIDTDGARYTWGQNLKSIYGSVKPRIYLPLRCKPNGLELNDIDFITVGSKHSLALSKKGVLYAWGSNVYGQLGAIHAPGVRKISGLPEIINISAGEQHCLAVTLDGFIYAWGWNPNGILGFKANNPNGDYPTPTIVPGLKNVIYTMGGKNCSFAITQEGKVYAWGNNDYGQLGLGDKNPHNNPQEILGLKNIIMIATGNYHTLALSKTGILYSWGQNQKGQLGLGTHKEFLTPQILPHLGKISKIAARGNHSLAITKDGELHAWGDNNFNEYGKEVFFNTPQKVPNLQEVLDVATGLAHTVAITKEGKVFAWGENDQGQLGLGDNIKTLTTPQCISELKNTKLFQIAKSIQERDLRTKIINSICPEETKQLLLKELDFINRPNSISRFFSSKRITQADSLKDFVSSGKNSIRAIYDKINNLKEINHQGKSKDKKKIETCLNNMIQILNGVKSFQPRQ